MEQKHDDDPNFLRLLQTLDQQKNWDGRPLVEYNGFWLPLRFFGSILSTLKQFKPENNDLILASFPKSGTTWLKALAVSIAGRNTIADGQSPLLNSNPHMLVPFFELDDPDHLKHLPSPRIISTHISYKTLPKSIHDESECKIIYICRNPLDTFVSYHYFLLDNKLGQGDGDTAQQPLGLDEALDMFCRGIYMYGPIWDHVLGYWKAHLEDPQRVLFLKYEDLQEDTAFYVKKIAAFMGCPFSEEEDKPGVIEEIVRLCSINNLKNLEVNKKGKFLGIVENSSYFRKGEVGDWRNHLSADMAERIKKIMESELEGSGLTFKI
ncbi:cytosolic sulfotransferase 5 [Phtheirospermum japonicum]|uniref:Sulfotransferase n=1 Tax=Phtheirospermum japonicum TaxID=374723 RepID=A0A830B3Q5_9LAMI|nr:cytosolic sulfotransferase 5 [Phtheirospermum japonicum]